MLWRSSGVAYRRDRARTGCAGEDVVAGPPAPGPRDGEGDTVAGRGGAGRGRRRRRAVGPPGAAPAQDAALGSPLLDEDEPDAARPDDDERFLREVPPHHGT